MLHFTNKFSLRKLQKLLICKGQKDKIPKKEKLINKSQLKGR